MGGAERGRLPPALCRCPSGQRGRPALRVRRSPRPGRAVPVRRSPKPGPAAAEPAAHRPGRAVPISQPSPGPCSAPQRAKPFPPASGLSGGGCPVQTPVSHMPSPPNTKRGRDPSAGAGEGSGPRSVRRWARRHRHPAPIAGRGRRRVGAARGWGTAGRYKYVVLFPLLSLHGPHKAPAKFTSTLLLGSLLLNRT